jgi:glycosyltransferase involved in cell wall biosynthesis
MTGPVLRVLAWPRAIRLNPHFASLNAGLEAHGCRVQAFNYWRGFVGRFDVLHIHFPTSPFGTRRVPIMVARLGLMIGVILATKARGRRVVWTVHNLADHERRYPALEARFMRWFVRRVDLTIHMSQSGRRLALERFPAIGTHATAVIPHAHYEAAPGAPMARADALERLGLPRDAVVLLALGHMRRYKNLPALIDAFAACPGDALRLVIAGKTGDPDLMEEIRARTGDPRVIMAYGAVPDATVPVYMAAATISVAAYRDILNSGSALLALSHACPVLVPDLGAMAELQSVAGSDWIRLFTPPVTADVLRSAIEWAGRPRTSRPDLAALSPDAMAAAHLRELRTLTAPAVVSKPRSRLAT